MLTTQIILRFAPLLFSPICSADSSHLRIITDSEETAVMDEELAEHVFDDAYGGYIRDIPQPEADAMWKSMELTSKIDERFAEKAKPEDKRLFGQAFENFAWERVPLGATHEAFIRVFEILDDQELRAEYADFLDAPLDTAEQKASAKAILLRITGLPATIPERPHAKEIRDQSNVIIEDVEVCCVAVATLSKSKKLMTSCLKLRWKDQPEKLAFFLTIFSKMSFEDEEESSLRMLMEKYSSEIDLVEKLKNYLEIIQRQDDEL